MKQFNKAKFLSSGKPHTFKMTLDDGWAKYEYDLNLTENWCMQEIRNEIEGIFKKYKRTISDGELFGAGYLENEKKKFTGLIDKNCKEVYEGDLINFSVNNTVELGDKDIMDYKNQEVYYDERLAGFYFGKDGFQILDKIMVETIEVVGHVNAN